MRSACIVLDLLRVIAVAILGRGDRLDPGRIFLWRQVEVLGLGVRAMAAWGQQDWNTPAQADQGGRRDRGQGGGYGGGYGSNRHRDDNRRRGGGGQFPQAAHNPYDVRFPHFLESIAECEDDDRKTSIIMVDTRDERIVSPFQAWLVREIMTNSSSSVNVLTERDQVMPPNSGYHLSLFANYTDWFSVWWLGRQDRSCLESRGFSAFHLAGAQGHLAIIYGREGLQRQRDPLPLDLPGLSRRH